MKWRIPPVAGLPNSLLRQGTKFFLIIAAGLVWLPFSPTLLAQTTRTWTGNTSSDWSTAGNWFPGGVPASGDIVVISSGSVVLTNNVLINSFTLSGGTLSITNGSLTTASNATLSGGTVRGGTLVASNGAGLIVSSGTLDGVTVNGNWEVGASGNGAALTVLDGLTVNGTLQVGNPTNSWYGVVNFSGTQTLGGSGAVVFGNQADNRYNALRVPGAGTGLTIGSGIMVRGQNGTIGYSAVYGGTTSVAVTNAGTISCDVSGGTITINAQPFVNQGLAEGINGGTLTLVSAWSNAGTFVESGGTLNLNGSFTNLGTINRTNGAIYLLGTLNNINATLTLNAASGSWVLSGGTVEGGVITTSGGAGLIVSSGTLDGVTVNGNWEVGASGNGAALTVLDGLTVNGTLQVGNPTNSWYGVVNFSGTQTLGGSGAVVFGNQADNRYNALRVPGAGTGLTIGSGIMVRGQNGTIGYSAVYGGTTSVAVTNAGTISCDVSGGTITINAQPFVNQGLAEGINGGTLTLVSAWSNAGTFVESGGTLNLNGSFTNLGTINRTNGAIYLLGTLNNINATLTLNAASGSWVLSGGTVEGGVITTSGGAGLIVSSGTLDGVTVNGNWEVGASGNGAALTVLDGLTVNGTLQVGNPTNSWYGVVNFSGTQTLGGSGAVVFGNQADNRYNALRVPGAGTGLTIGSGIMVRGQNGTIGYSAVYGGTTSVAVTNAGTISCDVSGGTITINAQPFVNQGLAEGINGGTLTLVSAWSNAGTFVESGGTLNLNGSFTNLGTINRTNGAIYLLGTLNNINATLTLNAASGSWVLSGGTVEGGVITTSGGAGLIVSSGTLDGVTVNGNWEVGASGNGAALTVLDGLTVNGTLQVGNPTNSWYGVVNFSGTQTLGGSGAVVFGNQADNRYNALRVPGAGTGLTIGSGIMVRGQNGTIGYSAVYGGTTSVAVTNAGTISCDVSGGTITINAQPFVNQGLAEGINGGTLTLVSAWSNAGTFVESGGTLNLNGSFTNLGTINRTNGAIYLLGTLNNINATLTLNAASGSWVLSGGTVEGGVITTSGGAGLIVSSGTLDGVTVNGNWEVGASGNGAALTVLDGLTVNGTLQVGNPTNSWYGVVNFSGTQTLGGSGAVVFGNQADNRYNALRVPGAGTGLTIGSGIMVRGQNGTIGYSAVYGGTTSVAVTNAGTISCDVSGGTITINAQPFVNQGLAEGINGGTLTLVSAWSNAGTFVESGGTLNLNGSFTNLGTINRTNGAIYLLGTLNNINATLTLNAASGSWVLSGGTVEGGVITTSGGAGLIVSSGTLDGVTVNGNWEVGASGNGAALTVLDGLTVNGTLQVGNPTNSWYGVVNFSGTQTLGGSGAVVFGNQADNRYNALRVPGAGTGLTIGSGIMVRGQNGTIGYSAVYGGTTSVAVTNAGTISCDVSGGTITINAQPFVNQGLAEGINGGTLTLVSAWSNAGTFVESGGTLNLNGSFTNLGTINRTNGAIYLLGTLNNINATLTLNAASGSWVLSGGTVEGGVITTSGGAGLIVSSGTLDGVTVNGNWEVGASGNGAALTVLDGLTVNGTLQVGNPTNSWYGVVNFSGTQTLGGSGAVVFGNQADNRYNALRVPGAGTGLTIGSGIMVRGQNGTIGYSAVYGGATSVAVTNAGTVSCDVSGGTITINAQPFVNNGLTEALNGATLTITGSFTNNGYIGVSGTFKMPTSSSSITLTYGPPPSYFFGPSFNVLTSPAIIRSPQSFLASKGGAATFSVTAIPSGLSYQWQFDGTNLVGGSRIAGAQTNSLTITSLQLGDAGNYQVVVNNTNGSVTSAAATLTVTANGVPVPATIAWTNPAPINYGTALSSIQLDATANVSGSFAYTPTNGAVLNAGTNTLSVVFTPTDLVDYSSATDSVSLVVLPASGSCVPPPSGLISWWRGEGNANDSVGTNNGTLLGGVIFTNGMVGQAFNLDGSTGYIDVPNSPSLNPSNQISVEAWYFPVSFSGSGNDSIVDKGYTSHTPPYYEYHLGVTGNQYSHEQAEFDFSVAAGVNGAGASTGVGFWTPGLWYHLVGTYDGSTVNLYVNGQLIDSEPGSGNITDYGQDLRIGTLDNYPSFLPGTIDEVSLYNRALTSNEVSALYHAGAAGKCLEPVNLLVNGSFETPGVLASSDQVGAAPSGWSLPFSMINSTAAGVQVGNVYLPPAEEGQQYVDIDNDSRYWGTVLSQTFTIGNSGNYALSWYDNIPYEGTPVIANYDVVMVDANKNVASSNYFSSMHYAAGASISNDWTLQSLNVALPSGTYTLSFSGDNPAHGYDVFIDNVSLTAETTSSNTGVAPSISTQPQSQVAQAGSSASFNVAATGTVPLHYQWRLYGTNLGDNSQITGSQSNVLNLGNVTPGNAGNYQVVVTNLFGSVTSTIANLIVSTSPGQPVVPVDGQVFLTNTILLPGVYHLPNGVSVGASGVTLDLNGASLVGSNGSNYGVASIGHNNVVIRNGTISGYYFGLRIESGTNIQVLNNVLSSNWIDPNSLTASPPNLNINVGPTLGDRVNLGGGLFVRDAMNAVISSNTLRYGENGMDLYNITLSTVNSNNASDNSGWGIHLYACSSNMVYSNVSDRCSRSNLNDSAGFLLVYGSSGNQILSNSFQYGGDGFFSGNENGCPSDGNLIQGNNGSYAGANAFEATFESGNRFIGNIADFSAYGFWLGYSHDGNLISSNSIRANNINGIEIDHGQHNTIEGNDIIGNGGSGIVLDTDGQSFSPNTSCLNLPNSASSSFYTISGNRIYGNYGSAMVLTATTDCLIYNNVFGGPIAGTVTSNGSNNVWSIPPQAGPNIVGGSTLGGNWWYDYAGMDTNSDGLGDTLLPYTNGGQLAAPGDPHPLIGSPDLGAQGNPQSLSNYAWIDLGRNTRSTGQVFDTANGAHFATDGANLLLLEGENSTGLSLLDPISSRYLSKASAPEGAEDGGDFQFGGVLYFATFGRGFDTSTGAGNGSRFYSYNPATDTWSTNAPTQVNGQLVCHEALAFDPVGNRLYATIIIVKTAAAGGDSTLLNKLAIYNPSSDAWGGATSASPDAWAGGTEAEYLDGCIYVWRGGFSGAAVNGSDSYLDVYNIASNTWTRTPSLLDSEVAPGFRSGGFDVWGISLTADVAHHRLFVMGAESNHQLYVFDVAAQTWTVGPSAPYDGGWGASIEYVASSDRLYQIDGRNAGGTPQGTAVLYNTKNPLPQVAGVTANFASPIPATTNFLLQLQFDRTMNPAISPTIAFTNAAPGAVQPQAGSNGQWSSVVYPNDTYTTPPITFGPGMDGTVQVFASGAADANGNKLILIKILTLNVLSTPPVVSLAAPINGTSFSVTNTISFSASAHSIYVLTNLTFYDGSNAVQSTQANNLSGSLNGLTAGNHPFFAVATDANGTSATSLVANVAVNLPGTMLINFEALNASAGPVEGEALNNYLAGFGVSATNVTPGTSLAAADDLVFLGVGVVQASSGVNFLAQTGANGAVSYTLLLASPCASVSWTRPELLAGPQGAFLPDWRAHILDIHGNELETAGESALASFTNLPAARFTLFGNKLTPGIASIRFDGNNQGISALSTLPLDDLLLSTLVVTNTLQVTLTSGGGTSFAAPARVVLNAGVTDSAGSVSQVSFYEGSNFLSAATPAGGVASLTLNNLAAGSYVFSAVASDSVGAVNGSAPFMVTVTNVPGVKVINFDALDTAAGSLGGAALSNYLSINFGVTLSNVTVGTALEAVNGGVVTGRGGAVASSPLNYFTQAGLSQPVSFTLVFQTPLQAFGFTRVALLAGAGGVSHPQWQATILDASGTELGSAGESLLQSATNLPARSFVLTGLNGDGIAAVRFDSDSQKTAAFSAVLLDDLILNANAVTPPLAVTLATSLPVSGISPAPAADNLSATVTDNLGPNNSASANYAVSFYVGPSLAGSAAVGANTFALNSLLAGTYVLRAQVVDASGVTAFSSPVTNRVGGTAGNSQLVNFDSLNAAQGSVTGASLNNYLAANGITLMTNITPGTSLAVENQAKIAGGAALAASSPANVVTQTGSNGPVSYTLKFANLLSHFGFTRPELLANPFVSHPLWQATAYDAAGVALDQAGEGLIGSYTNVGAQVFDLNGPGIASVQFASQGSGLTTFNAMVADDFVLTTNAAGVYFPPAVAMTSPPAGLQVNSPVNLLLTAQAVDGAGIASVTFYAKGAPIGTSALAPYSVEWTNPAAGNYDLTAVALDNRGLSRTSPVVNVTIVPSALVFEISTPPASQMAKTGSSVTFSVATTGTNAVAYQWYQNGSLLSGQTGSTLTLFPVNSGDAGSYTVTATSSGVTVTSAPPAVLTVAQPPVITTPPLGQMAPIGAKVVLSVAASGDGPFNYQWQLNGTGIAGATNNTYAIISAQTLNSGNYQVVVANSVAFIQSAPAVVQVQSGNGTLQTADNFSNRISINPLLGPVLGNNQNATLEPGEPALIAGKSADKSIWYTWPASFTGVISLTTQGSDFDTLLAVYTGANLAQLSLVAADDDSGGYFASLVTFNVTAGTSYQISVDGFKGASGNVVLGMPSGTSYRVLAPSSANHVPLITNQPASQLVQAGAKATLSVGAANALSYQWYYQGAPVANGGKGSSLVLTNFQASEVGFYNVLVANATGSVASESASMQIAAPNQPGAGGSTQDKFGDAVDLAKSAPAPSLSKPEAGGGDTRGFSLSQVFSTVGATKEAGEPNHCGQAGGASQWFIYTAPANGTLNVNTAGSSYNTIVAVYTGPGTNFASLIPQACGFVTNYQKQGQPNLVIPNVAQGTKFFIAVDGYNGANGTVKLHIGLGAAPSLVSPPVSQRVTPGSNATFSVTAVGTTNFGYQWQFNGVSLPKATNSSYLVTNAQAAAEGSYNVIVSNVVGVVTSAPPATLTLQRSPAIIAQPTNETVILGQKAGFAATVAGVNVKTNLMHYQWRYGNYAASAAVTGATSFSLTFPAAQYANNGSYFVIVTNNYGAATSAVAALTVRDTNAPLVAFSKPANNFSTNGNLVTVTGTASDNAAVARVEIEVNQNGFKPANGTTKWTNVVALVPGANLITAQSVDLAGNVSAPATLHLIYEASSLFTVLANAGGQVTSKSGATNGAHLIIGTNYTIAATPGSNFLFKNWTSGTSPAALTNFPGGTNLTFLMFTNMVLQANFVGNPFPAVAGVYSGLFHPTNSVTEASSGFITATLTSNGKGTFTAKLLLDGGSNSFSGSFDLTGMAQTNLARAGKSALNVTLNLDLNPAEARMTGTVSNNEAAGWNSVIQADRAVFNLNANPATNYAGQFTLLLPPGTNAPAGGPDGYGYAAITNSLAGISTLGGALADGTPLLWSVPIAQDGSIPLYQSLYSGRGSLLGWIVFTNQPPQAVSGQVSWIKPAIPQTLYPAGFTNLSVMGALGSPYTNTTAEGVPVLNLTHATLLLTNGNLAAGFLLYTNLGTNSASHNTLTNLDAGTALEPSNRLVIAINPNNGVATVTFQATGGKTNTIAHGAVLQNQTKALGAFPGTNRSGSFILH